MMKWFEGMLSAAGVGLVLLGVYCIWECRDLPSEPEIRSRLFAHYHPRGRSTWLPLWVISPKLQTAVVLWEDPQFYFHHGLAYDEIGRAFVEDVRTRRYARGGSTITQQVAKNLFLGKEKTLRRKLREAVMAHRLEHTLDKNEILEIYLNIADWGDGIVGAEAASRFYFSKPARSLDWAEAAMLAAMLANPHRFNPSRDPQQVLRLRQAVLRQLLNDGDIEEYDFRQASAESLPEHRP